jgi:hypothetical protein
MAASLVGQNVTPTATTQIVNPAASGTTTTASDGSLGSLLTSALTAASGVYGSQNAAQAQQQADVAAMGTQQTAMSNINSLWQPQQATGVNAVTALGNAQGLNGAAPDYSGFENMPGYQFAIQQGTQAAQRTASAQGSAYTPNTAAAVGQYVTGTAMQDYNTYIQQLLSTAGLGSTANQNLQGAQLQTSANISQLQQNTGQAAASGVASGSNAVAGQIGNILSGLLGSGGNGSGVGGAIGSLFGNGNSAATGAINAANTALGAYNASGIGNPSSINTSTLFSGSPIMGSGTTTPANINDPSTWNVSSALPQYGTVPTTTTTPDITNPSTWDLNGTGSNYTYNPYTDPTNP